MKRKIEIKRIQVEGRKVWQWRILEGRKILFGGLCATKKEAAQIIAALAQSEGVR
jgi:hypothetical protein